jgi:hypothetical protein
MTIHRKGLAAHSLRVPLVFRFNHLRGKKKSIFCIFLKSNWEMVIYSMNWSHVNSMQGSAQYCWSGGYLFNLIWANKANFNNFMVKMLMFRPSNVHPILTELCLWGRINYQQLQSTANNYILTIKMGIDSFCLLSSTVPVSLKTFDQTNDEKSQVSHTVKFLKKLKKTILYRTYVSPSFI